MELVDSFKEKKVLVIGDVMIDKYVYGTATRISPEAPVPVVKISSEDNVLGGAGNAANNIRALGAQVMLCGVVGDDKDGKLFEQLLKEKKITSLILTDNERMTTVKKRIIAGNNYQLIRIDYEKTNDLCDEMQKKLFEEIRKNVKQCDSILISDYAKGVVCEKLARSIIKLAKENNKPVLVDAKPDKMMAFKDCYLITPNLKEAQEMTGSKDIVEMGKKITKMLGCNVFITRGPEGISVFDRQGRHSHIPPVSITKLFDVTGAGDTVIATAALGIVSGLDLIETAKLSNYAAGLVVQKPGTSIITPDELKSAYRQEISHFLKESIEVKQKVIEQQLDKIEKAAHMFIKAYQTGNKVIAFGNGGSASDAQHLVGELVGRFKIERKGLPAMALTTDSSVVTAIANDYGYEKVFERQIEANAKKGDLVVAISTSGNSPNVINAIAAAKKEGCRVIGLSGKNGGEMAKICDICIVVPSENTPRIQEAHISIIHILCELLDKELSK
jgi:phosphoheptose isomerase